MSAAVVADTSGSPEAVTAHLGFLGPFFALDTRASSAATRALLDWTPVELGLIEDIERNYVAS